MGDSTIPNIDWAKTYATLKMAEAYAEAVRSLGVPGRADIWIIPVVKGLTCDKVVKAFEELGIIVCTSAESIDDELKHLERNLDQGSYLVGFRKTVDADESCLDSAGKFLSGNGFRGITPQEYLVLGLGYFISTGRLLDTRSFTACLGARDSGGEPPVIYSVDGQIWIVFSYPEDESLRTRAIAIDAEFH